MKKESDVALKMFGAEIVNNFQGALMMNSTEYNFVNNTTTRKRYLKRVDTKAEIRPFSKVSAFATPIISDKVLFRPL